MTGSVAHAEPAGARALDELGELLAAAPARRLGVDECERCVALAQTAPGKVREVAEALAAQRSPAGVDALLRLPARTPGVLEGLYQAIRHGVARTRPDGRAFARRLAFDFRHGRARDFADIVNRAHRGLGDAVDEGARFERLEVDTSLHYRASLPPEAWSPERGMDVLWLQRRLGRLRGARLWLNGWCFPQDGSVRTAAQAHLVEAWLDWARERAAPRGARSR